MSHNLKEKLKKSIADEVETKRNELQAEMAEHKNQLALKWQFHATKTVKNYLSIDERHQTWMLLCEKSLKNMVFHYEDLLAAEILQHNEQVTSGSLGSVVAGGLLSGGVGAIVGGLAGPKATKEVCSGLQIKLTMKGLQHPVVYLSFLSTSAKMGSPLYQEAVKKADECMAVLTHIMASTGVLNTANINGTHGFSAVDELLKYKQLLDDGAITPEEYETQKARILKS